MTQRSPPRNHTHVQSKTKCPNHTGQNAETIPWPAVSQCGSHNGKKYKEVNLLSGASMRPGKIGGRVNIDTKAGITGVMGSLLRQNH